MSKKNMISENEYLKAKQIIKAYEDRYKQIIKAYEDRCKAEFVKKVTSLKRNDFVTYTGGIYSKHMTLNKKYRLTGPPWEHYKSTNENKVYVFAFMNDGGYRMERRHIFFDF